MTNKVKCCTVLELAAMLLVFGPLQAAPPAAATAPTTRPIVSEPLTSQLLALCKRQQPYRVANLAAGTANFTVASEYPCAVYTPGLAMAAVVVPP